MAQRCEICRQTAEGKCLFSIQIEREFGATGCCRKCATIGRNKAEYERISRLNVVQGNGKIGGDAEGGSSGYIHSRYAVILEHDFRTYTGADFRASTYDVAAVPFITKFFFVFGADGNRFPVEIDFRVQIIAVCLSKEKSRDNADQYTDDEPFHDIRRQSR